MSLGKLLGLIGTVLGVGIGCPGGLSWIVMGGSGCRGMIRYLCLILGELIGLTKWKYCLLSKLMSTMLRTITTLSKLYKK